MKLSFALTSNVCEDVMISTLHSSLKTFKVELTFLVVRGLRNFCYTLHLCEFQIALMVINEKDSI